MTELVGVTTNLRTITHLTPKTIWESGEDRLRTLCGMDRERNQLILDWSQGVRISDDEICIRCRGYVAERDR